MNDAHEFESTMEALKILNFSEIEITTIFRMCAGILNLGNVQFKGEDIASVSNPDYLNRAAELFGVKPDVLQNAIIKPRITVNNEKIAKNMTPAKAAISRDSLAKAIYGRMFLWVVDKINQTLNVKKSDELFIGILDIAGFEIFRHNSFEQLCINFTNERLQQFFNNFMFISEQEEYQKEKITWTVINFGIDSQATIDLISKPQRGLLALLDEECIMPNGTDKAYSSKVLKAYQGKHPKFSQEKLARETNWNIHHYAGTVTYDCNEWCEKNKDPLETDLELAMSNSSNPIVKKFFTEFGLSESATEQRTKTTKKASSFFTVGSQYKEQLDSLLNTLGKTRPHFVRCIIPNHRKIPGEIDDEIVLDQLACNGVLEGIKISRMGYPNRMVYKEFHKRYYILASDVSPSAPDSKSATTKIIQSLVAKGIIEETKIQFGLTKIFFRVGQLALIEEERERVVGAMIPVIQASARGYIARKIYQQKRDRLLASQIIQEYVRYYMEIKDWAWYQIYLKVKAAAPTLNIQLEINQTKKRIEDTISLINETLLETQKLREMAEDVEIDVDAEKEILKKQNLFYDDLKMDYEELEAAKKSLIQLQYDQEEDLLDKKNKITALESSRNLLELEVLHVEKTGGDFTQILDKLEKEVQIINEKMGSRKLELAQLLENNENMTKENEHLQNEFDVLSDDLEVLTTQSSNLKRVNAVLEDEIDQQSEDVERYSSMVSDLIKKIAELEPEVNKTATQLHDYEHEKIDLEASIKFLEEELDRLTLELEIEAKKKATLEKEKKSMELDIEELEEDVIVEKKNIDALSKKCATSSGLYEALNKEYEEVKEKCNVLSKNKQKLQGEVEALLKQLQERENILNKLDKEKKALLKQIDEVTMVLEGEDTAIANLEKKNQTLTDNITKLNDRIKNEGGENSKLNKNCEKLEQQIQSLQKQLGNYRNAKEEAEKSGKQVSSQIYDARLELSESRAELEKTELLVKKLEKQATLLEKTKAESLQKTESSSDKSEILEKDLKKAQAEQKEVSDKRDKLKIITKRLDTEVNVIKPKLHEVSDARSRLDKEVKNLASQVEGLSEQNDNLTTTNVNSERMVQKLSSTLEDLKNEFKEKDALLQKHNTKIEKMQEDLKGSKTQLQNLQQQKEAKLYQQERTIENIQSLKDNINISQQQYKNFEESIRGLEKRLNALNEDKEQAIKLKKLVELKLSDLQNVKTESKGKGDLKKFEKLQLKKDKLTLEIKNYKAEIAREIDMKNKLFNELEKSKTSLEHLKSDVSTIITKKNGIDKENEKIRFQIQTLKGRLKRQEDANKLLEKDCRDTEKEVYNASQNALFRMDRAEEMNELKMLIEQAKEELRLERQGALQLGKEEMELEDILTSLQEEAHRSSKEKNVVAGVEGPLVALVKETRDQLRKIKNLRTARENEVRGMDPWIINLNDELWALSQQTDEITQIRLNLEADLLDVKRNIEREAKKRLEAERQLRDMKLLLKKQSEPLPDLEAANQDLKKKLRQISRMRREWKELDADIEAYREVIDSLRVTANGLSKAIEEEKRINLSISLENEDVTIEVDNARTEAEVATFSRKSFESILKDLTTQAEQLKLDLKKEIALGDELEGVNIALDNEADGIKEWKEKNEEANKTLREVIAELKKEKETLSQQLEEETTQNQTWNENRRRWREQLLEARGTAEDAQIKMLKLKTELSEKEEKSDKVNRRIQPKENKKNHGVPREIKLECKVRKLQALLEGQIQSSEKAVQELQRKKNELLNLRGSVSELRDDYKTVKLKIRQAKDPRRRLGDRLIAGNATLAQKKMTKVK
eukprot:TRINITY_DN7341_c0_g1_i1.p1 TRINITY_DN7341_c0_g1~~TRINITY_DN7341_c0_g1_i1.p1  ORF type:complete len:2129 (-),score=642.61 TRINITY_DN7341_c0_g1_i1:79-5514(-)